MIRARLSLSALFVLVFLAGIGASTPAFALPVISELFYDAVGSDDGQSFVELWGEPGTLLDGLLLEGINGSNGGVTVSVPLVGTIPADGIFLLADTFSGGGTAVPDADLLASFDFQNGPDSVVLRDGDGVLDAVGYGTFGAGEVFAGEGSPAVDGAPGSSLARWFADVDSDDNALDFTVLDTPTPGFAPLSVPEPGSGSLMLSALGVALWLRRRDR